MKIADTSPRPDVVVLDARGGLEDAEARVLIDEMYARIDKGLAGVVVDCSKVDMLSSFELGLMTQIHARLRMKGAGLKVCSVKPFIKEILRLTSLDRVFEIQDDLASAIASLGQAGGSSPPRR